MKKLEIYQVGKLPPLTVVECDYVEIIETCKVPKLNLYKRLQADEYKIIATFFLNNIAGFKEV